jgi:hypothetical protein
MNNRKPTVAAAALIKMAERNEAHANESHRAWILVGDLESFGRNMREAAVLRRAASEPSLHVRREILRNNGIAA